MAVHGAQPEAAPSQAFVRELRRALNRLYDWAELRSSPLVGWLMLQDERDTSAALRERLVRAIEALKPPAEVPAKARPWRVYQLLHARFVEQFTQREVAAELGLSIRHLRREEADALRALAALLWNEHDVGRRWACLPTAESAVAATPLLGPGRTPTRAQELEWLQESSPSEPVEVPELVGGALRLAQSVAQAMQVELASRLPEGLPRLQVRPVPTSEALLNVLVAAIRRAPRGRVVTRARLEAGHVVVTVEAQPERVSGGASESDGELLDMARRLVALSDGTVETGGHQAPEGVFTIEVTLPAQPQVPVLVVDDNADTLRLLELYLVNSRYRFIGTADPREAIALAEGVRPGAIVLDVMLPSIQGWELLGRLREHPRLHGVPIVICTILPQEELAASLGAAAFLRKPVTRRTLLATLDRLMEPTETESR